MFGFLQLLMNILFSRNVTSGLPCINMSLVFVDISSYFSSSIQKKELELHMYMYLRDVCCQITIKQIEITGILILLVNVSEKKDAEWMLHQKAAELKKTVGKDFT